MIAKRVALHPEAVGRKSTTYDVGRISNPSVNAGRIANPSYGSIISCRLPESAWRQFV